MGENIDFFAENFRILLRTVHYDRKRKLSEAGPRSVSEEDMETLFGDWTCIQHLENIPLPVDSIVRKTSIPGSKCDENVYLLTPKK